MISAIATIEQLVGCSGYIYHRYFVLHCKNKIVKITHWFVITVARI